MKKLKKLSLFCAVALLTSDMPMGMEQKQKNSEQTDDGNKVAAQQQTETATDKVNYDNTQSRPEAQLKKTQQQTEFATDKVNYNQNREDTPEDDDQHYDFRSAWEQCTGQVDQQEEPIPNGLSLNKEHNYSPQIVYKDIYNDIGHFKLFSESFHISIDAE
jgi:hypothetical protein